MQKRLAILLVLAGLMLTAPSCGEPAALLEGSSSTRLPAIQPGHPLYDRVEGAAYENDCSIDTDCHLGGCSSEVCTAVEGVVTTCEVIAWPPAEASCGCVDSQCIWYVPMANGSPTVGQD